MLNYCLRKFFTETQFKFVNIFQSNYSFKSLPTLKINLGTKLLHDKSMGISVSASMMIKVVLQ